MRYTTPRYTRGDKVICIDSAGWADHITQGREYTVLGYEHFDVKRGWLLWLTADDEGRSCTAFEDRFVPAKSEG